MSGVDDDAVAETLAASGATQPERPSRSQLDRFVPGSSIGRYQLRSRLGAGAMGVVWSARDPQLDRDVAIKLVHPELASEEASTRLLREARAMAKLSHRAVITVHDAGEADGTLFLAMELVRGTTLGQLLRDRENASDWRRWLAMMLEAGRGLADAHQHGVLHRDFKPDNVLVDPSGRVCVGDFGLAMLGDSLAAEQSRRWEAAKVLDSASLELTTTGALLGTPVYMSPQQLRGEAIDARGDQFAFCVATWEALYGARPFTVTERGFEAVHALLAAIERGVPTPPASSVPDAVREVLARGMAVDPSARWPDMDVLLVALDRAANRPPTVTPPRRRRWPLVAGAIGVLAIAGGVYWLTRDRGSHVTTFRRTERFSVPLRARMALSPDGSRLAVSSSRLEVYDTADYKLPRQIPIQDPATEVDMVELDRDELRFSIAGRPEVYRWRYTTDGGIETVTTNVGNGVWRGTTVAGELLESIDEMAFSVAQSGREVNRWQMRNPVKIYSIAPGKTQVAALDQDRFGGAIVVFDVTRTRVLRSAPIIEPTALTWMDDATLLYATSGSSSPTAAPMARLFRLPVGETGFGEPVEIYSIPTTGAFGRLDYRGSTIYTFEVHPQPNGNLVMRGEGAADVIPFERGAVPLGWLDQDTVAWNRESHRVVRYGHTVQQTAIVLDAEPANATIAGDSLIVSLRRTGGRETAAFSLNDGVRQWRHDDGKTLAVRCAGDRHPPCFAIRTGDDDRVVRLDAGSGRYSPVPIATGKSRTIEDIAVSDDGTRILIAGASSKALREIDPQGRVLRELDGHLSLTRTVAYDPAGDFIVGGTGTQTSVALGSIRTSYLLKAVDHNGVEQRLAKEGDGILLLARPAANKQRVSYVARPYEPVLVELTPQ